MTRRAKALHGWWPRFSRYEFLDGRICPSKGARLERYDPWQEYEAARNRGEAPPYVELLNLLRDIRPHTRREFQRHEIERILEWTRRHGLLGVLHEHLLAVSYDLDSSMFERFILVGPRLKVVTEGVRPRLYGDWALDYPEKSMRSTPRGSYAICVTENESYFEDQFLLPFWSSDFNPATEETSRLHSSGVRNVSDLMGYVGYEDEGDEEIYTADTTSDEFWMHYCEPIEHWFGEVFAFAEAVCGSDEFSLSAMVSKIRLNFTTINGKPELQHTHNSLLSAMAFMYAQDQITGYRLMRCAGCGSEMVTSAYQARYCSRTCGDRDRKRRSRAAANSMLRSKKKRKT